MPALWSFMKGFLRKQNRVVRRPGSTLAVGAGVRVLLQPGVALNDDGTLSFASGDGVTFGATNDFATEQVVVGAGGLLSAASTTLTTSATNNTAQISISAGGKFTPSGSVEATLANILAVACKETPR